MHDAHVVYSGDAIEFVGAGERTPPRKPLREGQSAPAPYAPDATLLPGLIEAHAHLFLEGGELDASRRAAYLGTVTNLRKARPIVFDGNEFETDETGETVGL